MHVPKRPFVFYSEIRNFTVVPKQPFAYYSEIRNFTVLPKWPFVFFTAKCQILETIPKRLFVFHIKIRNLELHPNYHSFLTTKCGTFKVVSKHSPAFRQQIKKSKVASKLPFVF